TDGVVITTAVTIQPASVGGYPHGAIAVAQDIIYHLVGYTGHAGKAFGFQVQIVYAILCAYPMIGIVVGTDGMNKIIAEGIGIVITELVRVEFRAVESVATILGARPHVTNIILRSAPPGIGAHTIHHRILEKKYLLLCYR